MSTTPTGWIYVKQNWLTIIYLDLVKITDTNGISIIF